MISSKESAYIMLPEIIFSDLPFFFGGGRNKRTFSSTFIFIILLHVLYNGNRSILLYRVRSVACATREPWTTRIPPLVQHATILGTCWNISALSFSIIKKYTWFVSIEKSYFFFRISNFNKFVSTIFDNRKKEISIIIVRFERNQNTIIKISEHLRSPIIFRNL